MDTECYPDYWSIGFTNQDTGKRVVFELYAGNPLDRDGIRAVLRKYRIIGFNSISYDMPMIALAMSGASNKLLKQGNDDLITYRMLWWDFCRKYDVRIPDFIDHIDLFNVAPGVKLGLKKYGARMNYKRLQELPIDPSENVGEARRPLMRRYLANDLGTTRELGLNLKEEMELRAIMSAEYDIDLRSKSDAQIAEAIFKVEMKRITGIDLAEEKKKKQNQVKHHFFNYEPPSFIYFQTQELQDIFETIKLTEFEVMPGTKMQLPKAIRDIKLRIGFTDYTMGIGGLHSKEKSRSFESDDDNVIVDRDVRGYYPGLMLACGLVPKVIGKHFTPIFSAFVRRRDEAKDLAKKFTKLGDKIQAAKYKIISESLKIVNNGTFGKTGDPHSVLYGPNLMIQTTITGQLSILMLIERLELAKFTVISANTDGLVTVVPRDRRGVFAAMVFDWECETNLVTEEVEYAGVYSRDVNSYIALPHDHATNDKAKIKRKGLFAPAGLQNKHDPTFDICSTAVVNWLTKRDDIEETIRACTDFTQFVGVRQVAGGGEKDGEYLGKMVRWYYAEGERGSIVTCKKGARVAGTTGAKPCMDLPDEFPDDVDFEWYIREAYARLDDIGIVIPNPKDAGRVGYTLANLPNQKTVHVIDLTTRDTMCGKSEKEVRQPWIERKVVPGDMRTCKACQRAKQEERGFVDEEDFDKGVITE